MGFCYRVKLTSALVLLSLSWAACASGPRVTIPLTPMAQTHPHFDRLLQPYRPPLVQLKKKLMGMMPPHARHVAESAISVDETLNGMTPARNRYAQQLLFVARKLENDTSAEAAGLRLALAEEVSLLDYGYLLPISIWESGQPSRCESGNSVGAYDLEIRDFESDFTPFPLASSFFDDSSGGQNYNTSPIIAIGAFLLVPIIFTGAVAADIIMFPSGSWWWMNSSHETHRVPPLSPTVANTAKRIRKRSSRQLSMEEWQKMAPGDGWCLHETLEEVEKARFDKKVWDLYAGLREALEHDDMARAYELLQASPEETRPPLWSHAVSDNRLTVLHFLYHYRVQRPLEIPGKDNLLIEAMSKEEETARFLLERRIGDINHRGDDDESVLHAAVGSKSPNLVRLLLARGVDPNLPKNTDDGIETPLHRAMYAPNIKIIRALLDAGADPTIRDGEETPLEYLLRRHPEEKKIQALLEQALESRGACTYSESEKRIQCVRPTRPTEAE